MSKSNYKEEVSCIDGVQFGLLSSEEILRRSCAHVNDATLYDSNGEPKLGGLFDPRMGVIERKKRCKTCGQDCVKCPGHFGHIELAKPVYNTQYISYIKKILPCICIHCSKLLINKKVVKNVLNKKPVSRLDYIKSKTKTKHCGMLESDKNDDYDNNGCGADQPTKYLSQDMDYIIAEWSKELEDASGNKRREPLRQKMTPEIILAIFKRISVEDAEYLGFSPEWCMPKDMIFTVLPVAPPSVRPSVRMYNNQRSEDDLTHKYNDIIKSNNILKEKIEKPDSRPEDIIAYSHLLQYHVTTIIDNDAKGANMGSCKSRGGHVLKTFKQRINGKDGRFRSNLMGKRVDYSARSVISPDANLNIEELGVPREIAMNLTYPEIVNKYNINKMYQVVKNGSKVYPGAKSYQSSTDGRTRDLTYVDTEKIVLNYGDIIHRHLVDGDYVLFNRQPSLHKMSMMAHKVRVMDGSTFRLNVDVCTPYNADFDGDEMNMHVPQSIQTAMELKYLCAVPKQIISPSKNAPIIKPSQDNLLGLYKITDDNVFFGQQELMNLLMNVEAFDGEFPEPAINEDNIVKWTGKQVFSIILPPISLKKGGEIVKGQLIKGQVSKKLSAMIVHTIFNEYGYIRTQQYINDLQKIISRYMVRSGFSIGIKDLIIHEDIRERNEKHIINAKKEVIDMTKQVHLNIFENVSKGLEEMYEAKIQQTLGKLSENIEEETIKLLDSDNRVNYMVASGSKGSAINIRQMSAALAQQTVDGKRIPLGFMDRSLPHFTRYDNGIESRGFVVNNFKDGLTPQEYFFHAMAGREGLIDTAVKTAKSGYLQRRLIKTTEDLKANHDYTVRNSNDQVVQFIYGEDGFNPIYLEEVSIESFILIKQEDLESKFFIKEEDDWDQYVLKKELHKMKKDVNRLSKMKQYNQSVVDKIKLFHQILMVYGKKSKASENKTDIQYNTYFPINFNRLLKNTKEIYKLDGKNKSDINPIELIETIDKLYHSCLVNGKPNQLFGFLLLDKMSISYLIKEIRITRVALQHIIMSIKNRFKFALVQGGEMVGPVAAQSIGEISTQLTLNSVDWETEMLFQENGESRVVKMGQFIDDLMDDKLNKHKIQHIPKNRTEYLELEKDHKLFVPSVDKVGDMEWCQVTAVTRHLPIGDLVKVTTESGREATATQQKSFLIWNEEKQQIVTTNGSDLKIGDLIPITQMLPDPDNIITHLDLSKYLPKTEWLYGTDFNHAGYLFDCDEREKKLGFWAMNGDKFTLPYSRSDAFQDAWNGNRMQSTTIVAGCIYPKTCIRVVSEILDTWKLNETLGFIVGIYLAEGWATDTFVGISNNDEIIRKKVTDWCDKMKVTYHLVTSTNQRFKGSQSNDLKLHSVLLARFFKKWTGTGSSNKKVPEEAFTAPLDFAKGILNGYISGHGSVNKDDGSIIASSVSKDLIIGISTLANRFGIFGKISGHQSKKNNIGSKNIKYTHTLTFRNGYAQIFAKDIGSSHPEKNSKLQNITLKKEYKHFTGKYRNHKNVILDPVKKIEFIAPTKETVYDLSVPKTLFFSVFSGFACVDTFHFAGVGEKSNVNQGVPRLEELLAKSKPKQPMLHIFLAPEYRKTKEMAELVQYNLELVTIGDILESDAVYLEPDNEYENVLPEDREIMEIYKVFSEIDEESQSIPNNPWVVRLEFNRREMIDKKITMEDINLILKHQLYKASIIYADDNSGKLIFRLRIDFDSNKSNAGDDLDYLTKQIEEIKGIIIKGVEGIEEVYRPKKNYNMIIPNGDTFTTEDEYYLETSGSNLFDVLTKKYIDSNRTISIDISEIYETFGIEAARWMLVNELTNVFVMSDTKTSPRHINLLCDMMTNRGKIMPAHRTGINQSDNDIGPLAKCSFEETMGQLVQASLFGSLDRLDGVSSNIMVGQIPKCGTGDSEIILDEEKLMNIEPELSESTQETDLAELFSSDEYCNQFQDIGFNLNNIESDDVNLEDLEIKVDF